MENIPGTSSKLISLNEQQIGKNWLFFISIFKNSSILCYFFVGADEILRRNDDDPPTKFTDLPQFCVEIILSFLRLHELNAVASVTNHLKLISIRVFDRKFKNLVIAHYPNKYEKYFALTYKYDRYTEHHDIGRMYTHQFSLLVENFGSMIRKLSMSIPNQSTLNNLTKEFSSRLVELNVFLVRRHIRLTQPFINLTKLTLILNDFEMNDSWFNLNHYFPELRCLEIRSTSSVDYQNVYKEAFIHNIPNLREFSHIDISLSRRHFDGFIRFLNINPQLNSLRLEGFLGELNNIQQNIAWDSFQIQHFNISTNGTLNVGTFARMKQLQSLKMTARQYLGLEIFKCNELKSASICFRKIPKPNDFKALVNLSPVLNNLNISFNEKLKENDLKGIVKQCNTLFNEMKQLKEIKIQIRKKQSLERLRQFESIVGNKIVALAQQHPNRSIRIWFGRREIPDLDIGVDFEGRFQTVYSKYKEEHAIESDYYTDKSSSAEIITESDEESDDEDSRDFNFDGSSDVDDNDSESDEYFADFNFDGSNDVGDSDDSFEYDNDGDSFVLYLIKRPRFN